MSVQRIQQPPPRQSLVLQEGNHFFTLPWFGWFTKLVAVVNGNLAAGFSGTIATAKLTSGGANGSMTFVNGILTAETPAT